MMGPWKPWKTKLRFPPVPTVPWKSHKPRFPHFHSAEDGSPLTNQQKRIAPFGRSLSKLNQRRFPQARTL